ncbi:MAG TPA: hypothetical protein PKJ78_01270 [Candidatus Hydrogenedentes bacterium]|nr:hypothetical protein [Candidatus Hydrogenedentota bacterium]
MCLCSVLTLASLAAENEPAAASSGVRVWVRPSAYEDAPQAQARFLLEDVVSPGDALTIPCQVSLTEGLSDPRIALYVFDGANALLFEGTTPLEGGEGTHNSSFTWPLANVSDGAYRVRLVVVHARDADVAWREVVLQKCTYGRLAQECEDLSRTMTALDDSMQRALNADVPTYSVVRAAIAADALQRAEELLEQGDWPRASALADFARTASDSARALITFAPLLPDVEAPVRPPSPTALETRDGTFYSSQEPVFLFGLHDSAMEPRSLAGLKRYGLNFAGIDASPAELLLDAQVNQELLSRVGEYLATADTSGIGVTVGLRTETAPPWLNAHAVDSDSPSGSGGPARPLDPGQARAICERQIQALAPVITKHPSVNGISLAYEPGFRWETKAVREQFIEAVARKYEGDRRLVNRVWRTRLRSLDEIEIMWDYTRASYQYDWQSWHQHMVSSHFAWLAGYADQFLPGIPKQVTLPDTVFEPGEARTGIDQEMLAGVGAVAACTADYAAGAPAYALPFPRPEILYRLLRSLAPGKPLVVLDADFDLASIPDEEGASRYVHSAMWEAAIAGVNGCAVAPGSVWQSPGSLEGLATACIDINRLGDIVTAFQRADAPIAVLWSMSSKIYRDGDTFLDSVQRVYEGCAFFGFPVRFITEDECNPAGLENVVVLVMPEVPAIADETFQALDAYAQAGGTVVRSGRPAPYTPNGGSRHEVISQTDRTIFMRASDTPTVYLQALDAAYEFGIFPSIPRTTNKYGYPLEGVKSRYTECEGQEYLYVINLRKEPVRTYLFGGSRQGRDVIRGRDVRFPITLEPLDPMLIRLEPQASALPGGEGSAAMAASEASETQNNPPSVELQPAVPQAP